MRRALRLVGTLLAGALLAGALTGCSEPTAPPPPPEPVIEDSPPVPPRVVVVNTQSETLSSLDLESGEMNVQAAVTGTWANRVSRLGSRLLVTSSGSNRIELLQAWDLVQIGTIDVGTGSNPWTAVPTAGPRVIVTNWLSGDARIVDTSAGTAGSPLPTTPGPEGVAVTGNRAWIACTNFQGQEGEYGEGRVDVVDLAAWSVISSVPVGRNPQEVLVAGDGRVHVLCTGTYGGGSVPEAGSVRVIDPGSQTVVSRLELGGSPGRLARSETGVVWVSGIEGGLRRYREDTLELLPDPSDGTLADPGFSGIDVDEVTGRVYVAHFASDLLLSLDGDSATISDVWIVGDGPVDVLVVRDDSGEEAR